MDALLQPIVGTPVLISVFLPSAFLPGVDGPDVLAFALVIAATALLSAVNAATAEAGRSAPYGCAGRCRRSSATSSTVASTRSITASSRGYAGLIGRLVGQRNLLLSQPSFLIVPRRLRPRRGCDRLHSDRGSGYLLVPAQLPNGAGARPHPARARIRSRHRQQTPGVDSGPSTLAGISALDNSSSLAMPVSRYLIPKEWSHVARARTYVAVCRADEKMAAIRKRGSWWFPAADPGHRQRPGFAMQVQRRDGNPLLSDQIGDTALARLDELSSAEMPQW